jgi:hypothetical protein
VHDGLPQPSRELLLQEGDDLVPAAKVSAGLHGLQFDDRLRVQHVA